MNETPKPESEPPVSNEPENVNAPAPVAAVKLRVTYKSLQWLSGLLKHEEGAKFTVNAIMQHSHNLIADALTAHALAAKSAADDARIAELEAENTGLRESGGMTDAEIEAELAAVKNAPPMTPEAIERALKFVQDEVKKSTITSLSAQVATLTLECNKHSAASATYRHELASEYLKHAITRGEVATLTKRVGELESLIEIYKSDARLHHAEMVEVRANSTRLCNRDIELQSDLATLTAERDALRNRVESQAFLAECANTPLMRDVMAERDRLSAQLATLTAERDRLAEIVSKLPKTADGVPITYGMTVAYWDEEADQPKDATWDSRGDWIETTVTAIYAKNFVDYRGEATIGVKANWEGGNLDVYSSRAAALAAKEGNTR